MLRDMSIKFLRNHLKTNPDLHPEKSETLEDRLRNTIFSNGENVP